ncbi:MAG TPA: DUF2007 domain-containing protein, partial [Planctomycetaceae bacterium]|nr:DUF2007 domain-containing protein [Planctomycetaceae bacterium]
WVEVYSAANAIDARLAQAQLEAAGISAFVAEESVAALYPNFSWAAPRVLVAPADAERAAQVLREQKESNPSGDLSQ